jgi:vWA-MoxR associated protein C-terminal domain/Effector-associated domain 2
MPEEYETARELLADHLVRVPLLQTEGDRESAINQLRRALPSLSVTPSANYKIHCINILDAVLTMPGGLQRLAKVLQFLDGGIQSDRFADLVDELLPSEFLTLDVWIAFIAEMSEFVQSGELPSYYYGVMRQADLLALDLDNQLASFGDLARLLEEQSRPEYEEHLLVLLCKHIAQRVPEARRRANRWAERLAEAPGYRSRAVGKGRARDRLGMRRSSRAVHDATEPVPPTLVLQLDPSGPQPDRYLFSAWLYLDGAFNDKVYGSDDPMPLDQVREALIVILREVSGKTEKLEPAHKMADLEFILPRPLLCHPFDEWRIAERDYRRLGVYFSLVVRDLDRLRDPLLRANLRQKWEQVRRANGLPVADLSYWVSCADEPWEPNRHHYQMLADDVVSLGVTFRPGDGAHPFDLAEALDAGVPIAVWPRRCVHSRAPDQAPAEGTFRDEVARRLGGHRLTDLRQIARTMRIDNASSGIPGAGLTLLLDDPTRRPEPDDFSLSVPGPLEGNL